MSGANCRPDRKTWLRDCSPEAAPGWLARTMSVSESGGTLEDRPNLEDECQSFM
jgi:hypothetical protein